MGGSHAIVQSRIAFRKKCVDGGGASSLLNHEIGTDVYGICGNDDWNNIAYASSSTRRVRSRLDPINQSPEMDAQYASIVRRLILSFGSHRDERLHVALTADDNELLALREVAAGSASMIVGRFRPIFAWALDQGAVGLILAHNHPSGDLTPSQPDILFTRQISQICCALEIKLIDHIIVSGRSALSMRKAGCI